MNTAKEVEQAVQSLLSAELAVFRAWFAEFDAKSWDAEIEADIASGKLDSLSEAALRPHKNV